jgi:hypothetical protein
VPAKAKVTAKFAATVDFPSEEKGRADVAIRLGPDVARIPRAEQGDPLGFALPPGAGNLPHERKREVVLQLQRRIDLIVQPMDEVDDRQAHQRAEHTAISELPDRIGPNGRGR